MCPWPAPIKLTGTNFPESSLHRRSQRDCWFCLFFFEWLDLLEFYKWAIALQEKQWVVCLINRSQYIILRYGSGVTKPTKDTGEQKTAGFSHLVLSFIPIFPSGKFILSCFIVCFWQAHQRRVEQSQSCLSNFTGPWNRFFWTLAIFIKKTWNAGMTDFHNSVQLTSYMLSVHETFVYSSGLVCCYVIRTEPIVKNWVSQIVFWTSCDCTRLNRSKRRCVYFTSVFCTVHINHKVDVSG